MAQNKNKDRKSKVDAFKQHQKDQAAKFSQPKTHLIPDVVFESTDILEIRGDIAEAFEISIGKAFLKIREANQELEKAGRAYQLFIAHNVKANKAKLVFNWNNGQPATQKEIEEYEIQAKAFAEKQQAEQAQKNAAKQENKSGLVTVDGAPLTEENLNKQSSSLII